MKKAWPFLLVALLLCPLALGQTVDEIVAKNVEAKGGLAAWQGVKSARMTAKLTISSPMGQMEAPIVMEFKAPNKLRVEFTMQGMTGIQVFDGEKGWSVMPFMGKPEPEPIAGDQLQELVERADFAGPLFDYKKKGHKLELLGEEDMEGTPSYKLKLTRKSGSVSTIYIDKEHFLDFMTVIKRKVRGNEMEVTNILGDFKKEGPLLIPHSIESSAGEGMGTQVVTLEKVELNIDLPDERFGKPAPATIEAPPPPHGS